MTEDISLIISKCLEIPSIKYRCNRRKNMDYYEEEKTRKELSRVIGYCILFRSYDDIDKYMSIETREEQRTFLKNKVASVIGIPLEKIDEKMNEIVLYIYEQFKENGFFFHAANGLSIEDKMKNGLRETCVNQQYQKELIEIANIYHKYGVDMILGWNELDIINNKRGWFYDGSAYNITLYADSPEWFNQFCGESINYLGVVPEELMHGYRNRDYDTARETIITLIEKKKMSEEDENKILAFFDKKWDKFKDTYPGVILVPISQLKFQELQEIDKEFLISVYLQSPTLLLDDVINCEIDRTFDNVCCDKDIPPEYLSSIDLTPVLSRFKVERNQDIER